MSLLLNEDITIIREGSGGEYVDGHYVPASDTSPAPTGKASIQPLSGREILQLPESDRIRQSVKIYTGIVFGNADIVQRDSDAKQYEIQRVENWAVFGGLQHFKAIGFLIDAQ